MCLELGADREETTQCDQPNSQFAHAAHPVLKLRASILLTWRWRHKHALRRHGIETTQVLSNGLLWPAMLKLIAIEMRSRLPRYGHTPCDSQLGKTINTPARGASLCDSPSATKSAPGNVTCGAYMIGATPRGSRTLNSPPSEGS